MKWTRRLALLAVLALAGCATRPLQLDQRRAPPTVQVAPAQTATDTAPDRSTSPARVPGDYPTAEPITPAPATNPGEAMRVSTQHLVATMPPVRFSGRVKP